MKLSEKSVVLTAKKLIFKRFENKEHNDEKFHFSIEIKVCLLFVFSIMLSVALMF